jgi:hypothetical protein
MPRFFFDTYDGDYFVRDEEGLELEHPEAAKIEAQKALPDITKDALPNGSHRTFIVSVRDEADKVLLRIALSMVIEEGALDE